MQTFLWALLHICLHVLVLLASLQAALNMGGRRRLSHLQHARKYEHGVHASIVLSFARVWSGQGNAFGVLHTRISEVFVSVVRMRVRFILVRVCASRESAGHVSWTFCRTCTAG